MVWQHGSKWHQYCSKARVVSNLSVDEQVPEFCHSLKNKIRLLSFLIPTHIPNDLMFIYGLVLASYLSIGDLNLFTTVSVFIAMCDHSD